MKDLTIALENRPGALAEMGEALGRAGVSIEGGGAFVFNGDCDDLIRGRAVSEEWMRELRS
jgi:hypothetical protein